MADTTAIAAHEDGYGVERLRRQFLDFAGDKKDEIAEQRQARHYYHGDQYSAADVATLKARKQPIITSNRIGRKIDGVIGLLERLRQEPKASPRTPQQEEGAELATATIRYCLDVNEWRAIAPECGRNGAVNGIGGIELFQTQGDQGDPDIGMAVVDPEAFFYDPRSIRADFSDARYMGIAKWMDLEEAQEMFPDKAEELESLVSQSSPSEQLQDREKQWVNATEKRVFLIEHWYIKGGQWHWCFYSNLTKLDGGTSPFRDEKNQSMCRFVMFSANIDHDGDRYGFVRNMKSPQDEINARRAKALHLMHTRRIIMEKGAVGNGSGGGNDVEAVRREAVRPDGVIEVNPDTRFEFDDVSKQADLRAQIEFLQEAKDEIENFGPNPALIGQGVEQKSGRAIALLQQAGVAELGPFIIAYRGWKIRVYRAVWNIIHTTWQGERWIRVTDDENVADFIQVNGVDVDPQTGFPVMVNALGSLDVDIILDEGPDTVNMMADTYDTLIALAQQGAAVPPDILIELSPLPGSQKKKLIERLQQAQQPSEEQQKAMQVQIAGEEAKVAETQSKTIKNLAQADAAVRPEPQQPMMIEGPEGPKPPSVSINFKDMPPEAQAQALADAGIFISPATLSVHQRQMVEQQAELKAQNRPQQAA
jgi:hypothetical protein